MASPYFVNQGKLRTLSLIMTSTMKAGLYKNSTLTPGITTSYSTLTVPSGTWYSPITLTFPTPTINASPEGDMTASPAVWSYSGTSASETVYGAFFYHAVTGNEALIVVQALDTSKAMAVTGDTITYTARLRDDQG